MLNEDYFSPEAWLSPVNILKFKVFCQRGFHHNQWQLIEILSPVLGKNAKASRQSLHTGHVVSNQ